MKKIDQSYCLYSKLINFEKEVRLFDYQDFVQLQLDQNIKSGNFGYVIDSCSGSDLIDFQIYSARFLSHFPVDPCGLDACHRELQSATAGPAEH